MADLFDIGIFSVEDTDGSVGAGWKLAFYATGTTTPQNVYADSDLQTSLGAVVTADSGGKFVGIYLDPANSYRAVLKTSDDVTTIYDLDPINSNINAGLVAFDQTETYAAGTVGKKLQQTVSPKDAPYNAAGDGSTDDSIALQSILSAEDHIHASFADTYAFQTGLTLTRNRVTIDGLKLKPVSTRNMTALTIGPTSPDASTTLSVNAAEFATTVTLTSATGFSVGKLILFTFSNPTWVAADPLAASYRFVTRIVGVAGSVIELQDALPQAIQSAWTHSVQAWTPVTGARIKLELDQSAQGQTKTVTAIGKANPAVLTVPSHGYTSGDTISLNGPLAGMVEIHGATAAITVIDANNFSIPVNSTA